MNIIKTIRFPGDIEPKEIYDEYARESIGDLSNLNTTDKSDLVHAINEAMTTGNVDLDGYLQQTELEGAINTALAQAKETGKFDGADGFSIYLYNKVITQNPDGIWELSRINILNPDGRPIVVGDLVISTRNNNLYRIIGYPDDETFYVELAGSIQGEKGEPGLVWMGEWDESIRYQKGEAVSFNGASYIYTYDHMIPPGLSPEDDAQNWDILAEKGDKGDDYTLTSMDKAEIAEMAAELVEVPDSGVDVYHVVQDTAPEDTSVIWVDTSDNSDDGFQEAVNMALAQAKASGQFDGEDYVLTSADKSEIVSAVLAALPVYNGEVV